MATNYLDTGDTGRAVSSESDGALFAGIFGAEKYVLENGSQLKAEVQSNNIVKISDGDAVMYGRHVRIQANDSALVTINNGHSGTNRIDLIVFRYTKDSTGKETVDLVVIQGEDSTRTPTAPTAVNGNILTGAMKSDFPLYSVELNGINIVKVNPLFNVIGNISKLKEELTELNGKLERKVDNQTLGVGKEIFTGQYLQNKPIYEKMIECGSLPNKTTKTVSTGLSGLDYFWINPANSMAFNRGATYPVPFSDNSNYNAISVRLTGSGSTITIVTANDWSGYACIISVKYTKK
jgi:hypothetical protein